MRLTVRSTFFALAMTASLGAAACGGSSGDDDGGGPTGDPHGFVIDKVNVPSDGTDPNYAFDLNGDGNIDNRLGSDIASLAVLSGGSFDIQAGIDKAVDDGSILLLVNIQATALDNAANAGTTVYLGKLGTPAAACTDPNMPDTCRQHLDGHGSFTVDTSGPTDATVVGNIVSGVFTNTTPGKIALQIAFSGAAINVELQQAHAQINGIQADGSAFGVSKVGGAISQSDLTTNVEPAIADSINDIIVRDCPNPQVPANPDGTGYPTYCGCADNSTGATILGSLNIDLQSDQHGDPIAGSYDCRISHDEFINNDTVKQLLAPDIDLGDGTMGLSVGVQITGIKGTFTAP